MPPSPFPARAPITSPSRSCRKPSAGIEYPAEARKQEKPRPPRDLGFSIYHQSLHFPSARAATRLRRPSARGSQKSRLESKPPTMGSAGVPPLVSSKQGEPSSRFLQSPDLLQASPVPFRSLTLVVDRDLTQPGWMRQSLIPITLEFMPEKRPGRPLLRKCADAEESLR